MTNVLVEPAPAGKPVPAATDASAPMRPLLVMIGVFLAIGIWGAIAQRQTAHDTALPLPARPAAVYFGLILMEWGLALYVWRAGLRGSGAALRSLIGGRWSGLRDVGVDAAIAFLTWAGWTAASRIWFRVWGADSAASVDSLLPHRPHEVALWILLSLSAGFSEELVFRGYLQTRLRALTGSLPLALLLQALVFGVSHGYQGVGACLRISAYGLAFGGLAAWRRTLRPGMLAHAWTDIAAGLLRF